MGPEYKTRFQPSLTCILPGRVYDPSMAFTPSTMKFGLTLFVSGLLLAACSSSQRATPIGPVAPSSTTPTAPVSAVSAPLSGVQPGLSALSGHVTEDSVPIPGASVNAWVQQSDGFGYSYMWKHGPIVSDQAGRFELTGFPQGVTVQLEVWKQGYVQQCASPQVTISGDARVDAQLVLRANVSATPRASDAGGRSVSGVVVQTTNGVKWPVANAFVDYEPVMDSPAATTYADSEGRFLLCGIPIDKPARLTASAGDGALGEVTVPAGSQTPVEIVLP
jgi:hypothetical protein